LEGYGHMKEQGGVVHVSQVDDELDRIRAEIAATVVALDRLIASRRPHLRLVEDGARISA